MAVTVIALNLATTGLVYQMVGLSWVDYILIALALVAAIYV